MADKKRISFPINWNDIALSIFSLIQKILLTFYKSFRQVSMFHSCGFLFPFMQRSQIAHSDLSVEEK